MKLKQGIGLLLAGVLALGGLGGCQKEKKAEQEGKKEVKGGYVEEEMEIPWGEGEAWLGSFFNTEKKLQIYTMLDSESSSPQIFSYNHQGGSDWEKQEETWAEEKLTPNSYLLYFIKGADENLYFLSGEETQEDTEESQSAVSEEGEIYIPPNELHLYRHTQEGETAEVPVECLEMQEQEKNGGYMPYYLGAAENGDIAMVGIGSADIVFYDGTTGKEKFSVKGHDIVTNNDGMSVIAGGTLATLSEENKALVLYDTASGDKTGKIDIAEQETGTGFLAAGEDGVYYLADGSGISVYKENSSLGEQIYDARRGIMGETESMSMQSFLAGFDKDFYAVYWNYQTNESKVCHYYYNGAVETQIDKKLSVYGLYESSMVQAAVRAFEKAHPNVQVDYQYAMKKEEEGNIEDYIDTLNTSLLNGEGADVLFLDDLPVKSYIEKGILEDITDFADKLVQEGVLLENVVNGAKSGTKNYELPAGIRLPVYYGTEEVMGRLESLDTVKAFLDENPKGKLLGAAAYQQIAYLLFGANYQELQEEGSFSQEKLQELLEVAKQLADNNPSEDMQETWGMYYKGRMTAGNTMTPFSGIGMLELYEETDIAGVDQLYGLASIAQICDILAKQPGLSIENPKGLYIPVNRMGINGDSKEKELAEEFVETMLSAEIQQQEFTEGLPVRTESLDKQADIAENSGQEEVFSVSYSGGKVHSYGYPTREQITPVLELVKQADTPLVLDSSVRTAFLDCAEQYYGGSVSAEEAAKTMCEKMDLYLSE